MESKLHKKVKRATPGFHWQRHEDKLTSGIADSSYAHRGVCGWVELKTYDSWPRNPKDPLKFTDLQPEQRNWLTARGRACHRVFILLQVKDDWLLLHWPCVRQLGTYTREQLLDLSLIHGTGAIDKEIADIFVQEI